jgi:hypothetical protein
MLDYMKQYVTRDITYAQGCMDLLGGIFGFQGEQELGYV